MSLRSKSYRRLAILAGVLCLVFVAGLVVYARNQYVRGQQLKADRVEGLKAYEALNYQKTVSQLMRVVDKSPEDDEAILAYADSRAKLDTHDGRGLSEARKLLRNLVLRAPSNTKARHILIDVYARSGLISELLQLTEESLAAHPDDLMSLRYRVEVLAQQNRLEEALTASRKLNALSPADLSAHIRTIEIMRRAKFPASEIVARAKAIADENPADNRLQLVLARARLIAGDATGSEDIVNRLLSEPIADDADFVRMLVDTLDRTGRFDQSEQLLERVSLEARAAELLEPLIERLWQGGRFADVAERLAPETSQAGASSTLISYHAMSLFSLNQAEAARKLLAVLESRRADRVAQNWSSAIKLRFDSPNVTLSESSTILRNLILNDPENPVLRSWLASNLSRAGDLDAAIESWTDSAKLAPSWATPHLEMSQSYLQAGRIEEAWQSARQAFQRQPGQRLTNNQLVVTTHLRLRKQPDLKMAAELLRSLETYNRQFPNEPTILPVYVASLARASRTAEAREAATSYLNSIQSKSAASLEQLFVVSQEHSLNLESAVIEAAKRVNQLSPDLALSESLAIEQQAGPVQAVQLFDAAPRVVGSLLDWRIARARLFESIDPTNAPGLWKQLTKDFPDQLAAHLTLLDEARTLRSDRQALSQSIEKIRILSGVDGGRYRIEQARWLMDGGSEEDLRKAAVLLGEVVQTSPDRLEPRLLLADALVRSNSLSNAASQLRAAIEQDSSDPRAAMALVGVLSRTGETREIQPILERLAAFEQTDPQQRLRVATALIDAARPDLSTQLLERADASNAIDPDGLLLLAELKAAAGETSDAARLYSRVLEAPNLNASSRLSAAAFLRRSGDEVRAQQLLSDCLAAAEMSTQPQQRLKAYLLAARYHAEFNEPDIARVLLENARKQAVASSQAWVQSIQFELAHGDRAGLEELSKQAADAMPGDPEVAAVLSEVRLAGATTPAELRELARALASDPARVAQARTLDSLADALERDSTGRVDEAFARSMVWLATQFPTSLPLYERAIALSVQFQLWPEATELARKVVESSPRNPAALKLASMTFRAAGRDAMAIEFAKRWKELAKTEIEKTESDLFMAAMSLDAGRYDQAAQWVRPHLGTLSNNPDRFSILLGVAADSLSQAGDLNGAIRLLEPMLVTNAAARSAWASSSRYAKEVIVRRDMLRQVARFIPKDETGDLEHAFVASEWLVLFESSGDSSDATRAAEEVREAAQRPGAAEGVVLLYADAQRRSGDIGGATKSLLDAAKDRRESGAITNAAAYALLSSNSSLEEAETLARRAIKLSPDNAVPLDTLARVLVARAMNEEASETFDRALKLDPNYLDAIVGKAALLAKMNKPDEVGLLRSRARNVIGQGTVPSHLRSEWASLAE